MKLPDYLYDKITDFQVHTGMFADLCEFAYVANDISCDAKTNERYSNAVM